MLRIEEGCFTHQLPVSFLKTQGMPEIASRGEAVSLQIKSAASFFLPVVIVT